MNSPKKQKNSLWYKYLDNASVRIRIEGHLPSSEEDPTVSDIKKEIVKETDLKIENFTLQIKRDTVYEELNEDLFNSYGNNYNTLRVNFNITKENPIKVEVTTSENDRIRELVEAQLATLQITKGTSTETETPSTSTTDQAIWVHYNNNPFSFPRHILEFLKVSNVDDLIGIIKLELKTSNKEVSEKVITLRRGENEVLGLETLISELYNTEDDALGVVVGDGSSSSEEKGKGKGSTEPNRIEEAFQIEYQGTTLETFYSRLKRFHNEWYKGINSYAPYLTIIQSSGSGKTRLVGELRTKGIYVLYICKRHGNSSGYPVSTPYVQKILETIRDRKFKALLYVVIKEIKNKNWSAIEFWNIQITDKTECDNFWKSVFDSLLQQKNLPSDFDNEKFVKELFPDMEISVVCCIDEAHELLKEAKDKETYFVQWRRQIREIPWHGFFNILLSTNGKIGNFLPPVTKDSSARLQDFAIFPAYLDVNTMDVLTSLSEKSNKDYNPERTAYLGIPLWGSLAQVGVSLKELIHLASQKIRNNDNDYLAKLACIACCLALEVSPRIAEVDNLIASHMATAIGVSFDRTCILCTYPSDTILASGALKGIIDIGWENCLDTLLELFSRGVVEAGERGELVNRIIFLKAYADSVKEHFPDLPITYLQKVPLKIFLNHLLHNEINKIKGLTKLLEEMEIDNAEIGFNHWTSLLATNKDYVKVGGNKFLTEDLVIEAYHRHTAFKMPLGFYNIDHIIPFKYPSGYGIITIQNKNAKESTFSLVDVSVLVSSFSAFGEQKDDYKILGIYIDLGLDREKPIEAKAELKTKNIPKTRSKAKKDNDQDTEKDNDQDTEKDNQEKEVEQIIYIQSIKTFKCDDEINKRLFKILFTRPWPLDTQWSMFNEKTVLNREDAIKSFLPLVFKQKQSLVDKWQLK